MRILIRFAMWILRTLILFLSIALIWQSIIPGYLLHEWLTLQLGRVIDWNNTYIQVANILAIVVLAAAFSIFLQGPKETAKKGGNTLSKTGCATLGAIGTLVARIWCWWWGIRFPGDTNN